MDHVEAWLRYYDKYKDSGKEKAMEAAWCKAVAKISGRVQQGKKATSAMVSAMSACIISLNFIDTEPRGIHEWVDTKFDGGSIMMDF